MPNIGTAHAVRLEFERGALVHGNLSGAAFTGSGRFWVAGDEPCTVDRLRRPPPNSKERVRFGQGRDFARADLLDVRQHR
jgi:hypothetical protein